MNNLEKIQELHITELEEVTGGRRRPARGGKASRQKSRKQWALLNALKRAPSHARATRKRT